MTTFRDSAVTTSASGASFSATRPTLTQAGDFQTAFIVSDATGGVSTISGGAAWTQIGSAQNVTNGDTQTVTLWAQVAGASEPSTYTVSKSGVQDAVVIIRADSGAYVSGGVAGAIAAQLATNPNLAPGSIPTSPVSIAANAITTTAPNQTVLWFGMVDWNSGTAAAFTDPASTTRRAVSTPAQFSNALAVDFVQATQGSTGTITGTGTLAAQAGNFVAWMVALKDAPVTLRRTPRRLNPTKKKAPTTYDYSGAGWFAAIMEPVGLFDRDMITPGGAPAPSQVNESVTFSDAQAGQVDFSSSRAESVSITDTQTSNAVFAGQRDESVALTDAQTGVVVGSTNNTNESVAFTDAQTAQAAFAVTESESVSFSDSQTASVVDAATEAESVTFTDAQVSGTAYAVARDESVALTDAQNAVFVVSGQRDEFVSFSDAQSSQLTAAAATSESVSLADVQTAQSVFSAERDESVAFTDSQDAVTTGSLGTVSESVTLTDSQNAVASVLNGTVSEAISLTDKQDGTLPASGAHSGYLRQVLIETYEREWEELQRAKRAAERSRLPPQLSPPPRVVRVKKVSPRHTEEFRPPEAPVKLPPTAPYSAPAGLSVTGQQLIWDAMTSLLDAEKLEQRIKTQAQRKRWDEEEDAMVMFLISNELLE